VEELTLQKLKGLPQGEVFAKGEIIDSPEGLHMARTGRMLKWVAIKGYNDDWCIYTHFADRGWDFVESCGDKVGGTDNILKVVPCDGEVLKRYRY
jgi:hypothetical protein